MSSRTALICGVAGLVYVPLAALEGADVLAAPELGASAGDVRFYLDGHATAMNLTALAGLLSLVAYAVFAVNLYGIVRQSETSSRLPWAAIALVGTLGGAVLAATGQVAAAVAAVSRNEMSDHSITSMWDASIVARSSAGVLAAFGLVGFGTADREGMAMPRPLARTAQGLGAILFAVSLMAVITHSESTRLVVVATFGLAAAWVFLVAAWLVLGRAGSPMVERSPDASWALIMRQVICLVLVCAAGVTGVALVIMPGATAELFSWGLAPRPLASLIGAWYMASAVVFARAVHPPGRRVRGLLAGALVFAVSTTIVTLAHTEVFDFDRLQAVAWIVLFPLFALSLLTVLVAEPAGTTHPEPSRSTDRHPTHPHPADPGDLADPIGAQVLGTGPRVAAGLLAALFATTAISLWVDPLGMGDALPYALPPMGGRFVGCWLALLAVAAASVAGRSIADSRLPALTLVTFPVAALLAAARVPTDLAGGPKTAGYVVICCGLAVVGAWLVSQASRSAHRPALSSEAAMARSAGSRRSTRPFPFDRRRRR